MQLISAHISYRTSVIKFYYNQLFLCKFITYVGSEIDSLLCEQFYIKVRVIR